MLTAIIISRPDLITLVFSVIGIAHTKLFIKYKEAYTSREMYIYACLSYVTLPMSKRSAYKQDLLFG